MASENKVIHVRLTDELAERYGRFTERFGGLPSCMVMRMLVQSVLESPFDDQVAVIEEQIGGGTAAKT